MQELTVIFLVIVSCCILYKYSLPGFMKYRFALFLSGLLSRLHAEKLAGYFRPDEEYKPSGNACHCCTSCHPIQNKTTEQPIRIYKKHNAPTDSTNP